MTDRAALMAQVKRKRLMEDVAAKRAADAGPVPIETSAGTAALRGTAQGAFLGFPDEMTAGVGAAKDWAAGKLGMRGDIGFGDAYGTYIDKIRGADKKAADDQPLAYGAGAVAGGIGSSVVGPLAALGSAGAATRAGGAVAKALPSALGGAATRTIGKEGLGRVALAGAQGAAMGAGSSEANPFASPDELGRFASDVTFGGAIGAGTAGMLNNVVAPAVKKGAKELPAWLGGIAERKAAKAALGNQSKPWDQLERKGRVNQFGRELLDEDIVTFGSSARGVAEKAGEKRAQAWDDIEALITQADGDGATVSLPTTGKRMTDWAASNMDETADATSIDKIVGIASDFERRGNIPLAEAQKMRGRWKFDPRDPQKLPVSKEIANKTYMELGDGMEDAFERYASKSVAKPAEQFGEMLGTGSGRMVPKNPEGSAVFKDATKMSVDPKDALAKYKKSKKLYGNMATAEDFAELMANRNEKNQSFGLGDKLAFIAGMMQDPKAAVLASVGNKVVRERGNSSLAVTLDKASKMLENSPDSLGKYAVILQKAASRGSLGVVHSMLMKEPDYAARMAADNP